MYFETRPATTRDPLMDYGYRWHVFDLPGDRYHLELVEKDTGLVTQFVIKGEGARLPGFIDDTLRCAIRERQRVRKEEREALAADYDYG